MDQKELIEKTVEFISWRFRNEASGHDWFHTDRVRKLALFLAEEEGADLFVVEMAALLHELDDWKLTDAEDAGSLPQTYMWMKSLGLSSDMQEKIVSVIRDVSFKGAGVETPAHSPEAKVVQDADRLDAMGAIGIARTFAYGGNHNRLIYDPEIEPVLHNRFDAYQTSQAPTINHFYEKLLLLKDRMNTNSAKVLAEKRHQFMEHYLSRFFDEWNIVT